MDQSQVDGIMEKARGRGGDAPAAASQPSTAAKAGLTMMILAGIAAIGTFATLFLVWYRLQPPDAHSSLRIAMDEFVAGRYELAELAATEVELDPVAQAEDNVVREFLLGAAGVLKSRGEEEPISMRIGITEAIPHLEALHKTGFPPGRSAEGRKILGLGLLTLGRYADAVAPLEQAIEDNPTYETELLLPLAEAKLRAGGSNLRSAESDMERLLAFPNLPRGLQDQANILKARIQAALGNWNRGRDILDKIQGSEFQDEIDLRLAELFIAHAKSIKEQTPPSDQDQNLPLPARELIDEALDILIDVIHRSEDEAGVDAAYLAARAHRIAGDRDEALSRFASLRQNSKFPTESIAAGLEEVELLTEMRNYSDAMLASKAVVRNIADPRSFDPKWLSLFEFRTRLEAIAETMRAQRAFPESIELARTLPPVVDQTTSVTMQAESHRRWGEDMAAQARQTQNPDLQTTLRADSRNQFRKAGQKFRQVARLRFEDPEYVSILWDAIDSFQQGRAYENSLELLDDYLRYEQRGLLPRGLIAKGEALMALGRLEESLPPLRDCVEEFPRDSLRFDARLLMAVAQLELGQTTEPLQLLDENIHDGRLSPESPVFRDSLFVAGEALYREALRENLRLTNPNLLGQRISPGDQPSLEVSKAFTRNQEVVLQAIDLLRQAKNFDQRDGNLERARHAQYLNAEAERLAAFWPTIQANDPQTLETDRRRHNARRREHLARSHKEFQDLKSELVTQMEGKSRMSPSQQAMLRNCFMGIADTLYEMGDLQEAVNAYQKVSQEFMNEPLAMEAMLQQSLCYDKLGDTENAKRVFQHAGDVLKRIPTEQDSRFAETTRYNRANWESLIDWLRRS